MLMNRIHFEEYTFEDLHVKEYFWKEYTFEKYTSDLIGGEDSGMS